MNYKSIIFSEYLSDELIGAIISDEAFINKMMQYEAALAKVQASLGVIPEQAADEICEVLSKIKIEPAKLADGTLQNGVPVITFLELIKTHLSGDAQNYLHYGTTSQDVMDTALVLIIKDVIAEIETRINILTENLSQLFNRYSDAPCMAHTRTQLAMPITFGTRIDAWRHPFQRHLQRIEEIKKRLLIVQLGGAVGTLSAFGEQGTALTEALAKQLNLLAAPSWHTQRDNLCEFSNWLAIITGTLGKIGADILVMSQSEIGEVIENAEDGGKSSAMPHKKNPVLSEALVAIAKINAQLQSQQLLSMVHTNERDGAAWILEWNAIPQMLINTGTALKHAITITQKMKVNQAKMKKNVDDFLKENQT